MGGRKTNSTCRESALKNVEIECTNINVTTEEKPPQVKSEQSE